MVIRRSGTTGVVYRGRTDWSLDVDYTPTTTLISSASSTPAVVQDRNVLVHSAAVVDTGASLIVTSDDQAIFKPYLRFESLTPSVATVDSNGIVTRVSDGTARILVRTSHRNRTIEVPVARAGGGSYQEFTSYAEGSLARHCTDAVDARIAGKTPSIAKPVYGDGTNYNSIIFYRNGSCWARNLDLTCVSPWTSAANAGWTANLISPRHVLMTRHWYVPPGREIRFIGSDNTQYARTVDDVIGLPQAGYQYDFVVGLLNADLPSDIKFAKVLPANIDSYFPSVSYNNPIPCLGFDNQDNALVTELISLGAQFVSCRKPTDATRLGFYEDLISGDSSNPLFMIINDEPILTTLWTFGGAGTGARIHGLISDINSLMTTLGGGYQLTTVDLSGFPTY